MSDADSADNRSARFGMFFKACRLGYELVDELDAWVQVQDGKDGSSWNVHVVPNLNRYGVELGRWPKGREYRKIEKVSMLWRSPVLAAMRIDKPRHPRRLVLDDDGTLIKEMP